MKGVEIQMLPKTESVISNSDFERLYVAIQAKLAQITEEKVMHRKDAATFLGIGTRQLDKLSNAGKLPYHRIDGLAAKLYLKSELIQLIKKS